MEYQVEMQHTEKSFEALAHMQYDLFCMGNRVARSLLSLVLVILGVVNFSQWWGILITAYGCYLVTSTYSAANHTAHKLTKQLRDSGLDFPASRYVFKKKAMEVISLPEETPLGRGRTPSGTSWRKRRPSLSRAGARRWSACSGS